MEIPLENNLEAICTVTELAKKLGLSRPRFYQLQKDGVFPMPIYCIRTRRPFYTLELQQKCIDIRRTGIGPNGQPIFFYAPRKNNTTTSQNQSNPKIRKFTEILKSMKLNITYNMVKKAIEELYPKGLDQEVIDRTVITNLSSYFSPRCENGV